MTAYSGALTDVALDTANMLLVDLIATNMVTEGWTILESNTVTGTDRLYIFNSDGESGTDDIYVGLRTYQSSGADYYNISLAYFEGWVDGFDYAAQPGYREKSMCAHNTDIFYWMTVNKNTVNLALNVNNGASWESGSMGYYLPYSSPGQLPYPISVFGMLNGQPSTRFSTLHYSGLKGTRQNCAAIRKIDGSIIDDEAIWPYSTEAFGSTNYSSLGGAGILEHDMRDGNGYYSVLPLVIVDYIDGNVHGEIDGWFFITGFNNAAGNTMVIGGDNYIIVQEGTQTGFSRFMALRLT